MERSTNPEKVVQGVTVVGNTCIWTNTGIIDSRECDSDFNCNTCVFGQAMHVALNFGEDEAAVDQTDWAKHLKKRYPGAYRPCRYVLTGLVDEPKICTGNYECYHCPFDQLLDQENYSLESRTANDRMTLVKGVSDSYPHLVAG